MNSLISLGSIVYLKSESKKMTVINIGNLNSPQGLMICCAWLDREDKLNQSWFPLVALELMTT